jgi:hypothetical protein
MEMMWAAQINAVSVAAGFTVALLAGMLDEIGIWNLAKKIAPLP